MIQHEEYIKINSRCNQIPIKEQCSIFLRLYSSELKYIAPWSQYDDNMDRSQNRKPQKTKNEFGTNKDKLKEIHISNDIEVIK